VLSRGGSGRVFRRVAVFRFILDQAGADAA
jgi:hypothetical protein